jgi:3-phosphoshikimate 1-carboxyvinyltransferase
MRVSIKPRRFSGTVRIPASKSHTIRQLLIAALAEGVSTIHYPLDSLDARSCAAACRVLGAEVTEHRAKDPLCPNSAGSDGKKLVGYTIRGNAGFSRNTPSSGLTRHIDVGNSGTTL